jgi:YtcA family
MTMISQKRDRFARAGIVLALLLLASCSRAPSFDILGSFFPAWLVCLIVAVLLTVFARWLLLRSRVGVAFPLLVYPGLTAIFTFALWLVLFN